MESTYIEQPRWNLPGITAERIALSEGPSKYDLTIYTRERDGVVDVRLVYNADLFSRDSTDLFDASTIERMVGHYLTLLEAIIADPDRKVSDLPLLSEVERHQLLVEWNDTAVDYPRDKLDPSAPVDRLSTLLETARPAVVLTDSSIYEILGDGDWKTLCHDRCRTLVDALPTITPEFEPVTTNDTAFLLPTSGSTGEPKIVVEPYRFVGANKAKVEGGRHLLKNDSGTAFTRAELGRPFRVGGTLYVAPPDLERDLPGLVEFIGGHRITHLLTTPTMLQGLLDCRDLEAVHCLETIDVIGERLPTEVLQRYFEHFHATLNFGYGCSEVPGATSRVCSPDDDDDGILHVGRPRNDCQVCVLDAEMRRSVVGVAGDVYLGGDVALGYLGAPEATSERFVPHPFGASPGARVFRTGDRGRWLEDGNLEILGRSDGWVKLRGYRIECGEIETALATHPAVKACVVGVREERPGDQRLVAWLVPAGGAEMRVNELRRHLAQSLPDYMVPSTFVALDAFPLTRSGKVDQNALPIPVPDRSAAVAEYVAPRTPIEELLHEIWREVLGIEQIGVHDSFFELGGHSLLAIKVLVRIEKECRVAIPVRTLFEIPTIAQIAEWILVELVAKEASPIDALGDITRENFLA